MCCAVYRRPCWISPYHLRIDWLMWFAAFQNYQVHYRVQTLSFSFKDYCVNVLSLVMWYWVQCKCV